MNYFKRRKEIKFAQDRAVLLSKLKGRAYAALDDGSVIPASLVSHQHRVTAIAYPPKVTQ